MKKTILILPFVVCLFIQLTSLQAQKQGQSLIDSLITELAKAKEDTSKVNVLNRLGQALSRVNENEKAITYLREALALSEKLNFEIGKGNALHSLGYEYVVQGDKSQAIKCYEEAIKIRAKIGDSKGLAGSYNNMGLTLRGQGNYSEALKMLFAALKINEAINDKKNIASNYNNIGILYWTQKDYTGALNIYAKALKIMEELGDKEGMNHPYNNMAGIYLDMGNYPEALKNYAISFKIREEMGDKNLIADSYNGIGNVYLKQNNYSEALKNFHAALKLKSEIGDKHGIATTYSNIGEVKRKLKNFAEARNFLTKAIVLYKEVDEPYELSFAYEQLAKLDSAMANYKSAHEHYKMYIFYRDSSVNKENTKKLVQTQMQYDFDKKEALAKAEQDKKDAIGKEEMQKQKLVRNSFVVGFAIVLLFAGVFFSQRNKIKKGKKRSDELLLNILPAETAEELKATGTAAAKDFDEVTVLFTDFKNFTQASEKMSAHELVNEINFYFSEFDKIISKHGIEKIKTIGDSYMAAGGLPVANKTNPIDTVAAALEIQSFMQQMSEQKQKEEKTFFEIRIGVHTGPVVAGIVGIKKFAYDIWGDTVNIASRMESSGETGKVNISGATYELVKDKFVCTYRGKINAKHKGEVDMYFVNT